MKKSFLIIGGVVFLAFIIFSWWRSTYNGFVTKEEAIKKQMGQLNNAYQQRLDLIPNLVATVQGSVAAEKSTLEAVIKARASATSIQLTPEALKDPNLFQNFQKVQDGLSSAISRLLVVTENYPDLKSQANFSTLMSQIEGQESRIRVERNRYNEVVQDFNTSIKTFPSSIIAGSTFTEYQYFQAAAGAQNAPTVDFGTGGAPSPEQTSPSTVAPAQNNPKGVAVPDPAPAR